MPYPPGERVDAARAFAEAAPGTVAFAVMDGQRGVRGLDPDAQFSSASVSKALLLAAELRRLARADEPLDGGTRSLLDSMITFSDNDAASAVYARVGDAGMQEVATAAGMRDFEVTPGYWGGAQVTAGDLARFFYDLDRNLPARFRAYGKRLLANVTSSQRWGIPAGAGGDWRVYFKGGWRPPATDRDKRTRHPPGGAAGPPLRAADRDRGPQRPVPGHDQLRHARGDHCPAARGGSAHPALAGALTLSLRRCGRPCGGGSAP